MSGDLGRLYDHVKRAVLGPAQKGTSMSYDENAEPADDTPDTADDTPDTGSDGDAIIAEAKAKQAANEELTGQHVRALEHPEEFEGQTVPAPDSGIAPTT